MNIAIVAPSPVPFVMGGAENLWLGLQRYINEETRYHCELFKIPSRENNCSELLDSYNYFAGLKYEGFDRLISTKYPAWAVDHENHVVYMQHTLRGLYDTYHFCGKSTAMEELPGDIASLLGKEINSNKDCQIFLGEAKKILDKYNELSDFPGPFIRKLVHKVDRFFMQPAKINKYAAISKTVANRSGYFPAGISPSIIYHPPRLEGFYCGGDDFVFTSSRLDGAKRVGLIIEAMKYVKSDIKLLIGGKGPDEIRLKELAAEDPRIEFLGFMDDKQILECYANAIAVPFVPYDEDYGLITIEAMKSGKPVITTHDAGGVTEFVINNETGLVVPPDAESLGKAIDTLCKNRGLAKEMGRNAREVVSNITWDNVVQGLIGTNKEKDKFYSLPSCKSKKNNFKKKKMLVGITFPISPPRGGGQSRVYYLYKEWSKLFDITVVCLAGSNEIYREKFITPSFLEIVIPKSAEHQDIENKISEKVDSIPVTDIVAVDYISKTEKFVEKISHYARDADIIVASHPYLIDILISSNVNADIWFEAHNVELDLKAKILPETSVGKELLDRVKHCEMLAWEKASVVFACAQADILRLEELYGKNNAKCYEVPNGFSKSEVSYITPVARSALKKKVCEKYSYLVLFLGSWHGPNFEAVDKIIDYAKILPSVTFLIAGSVGLKYKEDVLPENIRLLGVLNDIDKKIILSSVDLAINPMISGSGSNLKMLDYMASGVPVMSTDFGARGLNINSEEHYFKSEIQDFPKNIMKFFVELDDDFKHMVAQSASNFVFDNYEWSTIAEKGMENIIRL